MGGRWRGGAVFGGLMALMLCPACGSSGSPPSHAGSGGSRGYQDDCGAIASFPPILTVVDVMTGAPICDPSFSVVHCTYDPGPISSFPCGVGDCSSSSPDGAPPPCQFLLKLAPSVGANSCTLSVTAPGYATTTVDGVVSGIGGCVPTMIPGSNITVTLTPAPADGGAD